MSKYKVLWFDDECATLEIISEEAMNNDIELVGYANADEGLQELELNNWLYDAIVVDGLFFKSAGQVGDALDDEAFGMVAKRLGNLKAEGMVIPWFILSGNPSFVKEKNKFVSVLADKEFGNGKVYDKNKDEDTLELWAEIKQACANIDQSIIRHTHAKVFEVCTEKYVGEKAGKDLLRIIGKQDVQDINDYFNKLRHIVDDLFIAFSKHDLLPYEFVNPSVSLNPTSKFLSGYMEKGFTLNESSYLPKVISDNIRGILEVLQPASHRSYIDEHVQFTNTPYLFNSILYRLMDTIVWFKAHLDTDPIKGNWTKEKDESGSSTPSSLQLVTGSVLSIIHPKKFAFLKPDEGGDNVFIPDYLVLSNNLEIGTRLSVELGQSIDPETKVPKIWAKNISKIN